MTPPAEKHDGWFAHSLAGRPIDQWQSLRDHSVAVAQLASFFASPFGSSSWAEIAGWLHDLGKLHPLFQAYLLRENGLDASEWDEGGQGTKVNHSGAGALWARERWGRVFGTTLAYLVAGHHAGLPDWSSQYAGNGALSVRKPASLTTFGCACFFPAWWMRIFWIRSVYVPRSGGRPASGPQFGGVEAPV